MGYIRETRREARLGGVQRYAGARWTSRRRGCCPCRTPNGAYINGGSQVKGAAYLEVRIDDSIACFGEHGARAGRVWKGTRHSEYGRTTLAAWYEIRLRQVVLRNFLIHSTRHVEMVIYRTHLDTAANAETYL